MARVFVSLVVVASAGTCPGSRALFTHSKCQISATAAVSCNTVKAEMAARIKGVNGWYDQHNHGTYTMQQYGGDFSASRLTGDGKYTDKITFDLVSNGSSCDIAGCSESQVTSVSDFGTNYCNIKLLYCGSDEGCNVANSDFTNSGESVSKSTGASKGMANCLKVSA